MSGTCHAIATEELVAYWAGDLEPAEVDRLDEHLMGCDVCTAASAQLSAVTEALRAMIPPFVDHAKLESLRARGKRIQENPIQPGERTPVVFPANIDLLIHKLGGLDLTKVTNVAIVLSVEENGHVMLTEPNVPFDRDSGEVLIACQAHFSSYPPNVIAEVRCRDATGSEQVARYTIPHIFEARIAP